MSESIECPSCGKRTVTQTPSTHLYKCSRCHGQWTPATFRWLAKQAVKQGMEVGK